MNEQFAQFANIPEQSQSAPGRDSRQQQQLQQQQQQQQQEEIDLYGSTSSTTSPNLQSNLQRPPYNISSETTFQPLVSMTKDTIVADNGKICPYCRKEFTSKGILGRHLDSRKGDRLHPLEEINALRSLTKRRNYDIETSGTGVNPSTSKPIEEEFLKHPKKRKVSKKTLARSQISVDFVRGSKEKSKLRRKLRDRRIKAKILTNEWFLDQFGKHPLHHESERGDLTVNFVHITAMYLPISNWPESYPDHSSFDFVVNELKARDKLNLISSLTFNFHAFEQLSTQQRKELWQRETFNTLKSTIGKFSLGDLGEIKSFISKKEQANFEDICEKDNLSGFVDIEDDQESEHEEREEEQEPTDVVAEVARDPERFISQLSDTSGSIVDDFNIFRV
ncbi:uncharacterized protein J8A68_005079 [[Candida] subhashii]|uniref:C2H2-type domain-containing protein n=1 Tax=[Candida] subhashii TaxID=561895 RepID=A0A8J5UW06_9ASCO|nr:uncharacterized protein J8A68_005079 [[Candida] subhashii]KAG7661384.1 hypothetical protein J8A68_005079 [[Candida] subhashii]